MFNKTLTLVGFHSAALGFFSFLKKVTLELQLFALLVVILGLRPYLVNIS